MRLSHRLEQNATSTDYASIAIGEDICAVGTGQGRTIRVIARIGDRSFQNAPTVGVLWAQCNTDQEGVQIDVGVESGVCRLIVVSDGGATIRILRFLIPQGDTSFWVTLLNNGSNNWTIEAWLHKWKVASDTSTYTGGIASGQTAITLGVRSGPNDHLDVGSYVRADGWTSVLSSGDLATAWANGRPQNTAGPARYFDVLMGSGPADTATTAYDQTGNSRNLTLVGTWATGGFTRWDPANRTGLLFSWAYSGNTTGWDDFGNATISTGTSGLRITTSATDTRACAIYTAFPIMAANWMARAVVRMEVADTGVIGIGNTPDRTDAGALAATTNLFSGGKVNSLLAGEFTVDFGDAEVIRSNIPAGSGVTPVSGGSDVLIDTGATALDDYEIWVFVTGNRATAISRNLTNDGPPLSTSIDLDHAVGTSDLRHTTPSPGYLTIWNMTNTTYAEVLSVDCWSNVVEKPYCGWFTHSQANVGELQWAEGYVMAQNTLRFADGIYDWIEVIGRPGATIDEFTLFDAATSELENNRAINIAMCCALNTLGANDDAIAQADLEDLVDRCRGWTRAPNHIRLVCEPPSDVGGESLLDWQTNLTTIANSYPNGVSTSFAMHAGMGNPPGTNNRTETDFVGLGDVHLSPAGHVRAADFNHDGNAAVFPPATVPRQFGVRPFQHYAAR